MRVRKLSLLLTLDRIEMSECRYSVGYAPSGLSICIQPSCRRIIDRGALRIGSGGSWFHWSCASASTPLLRDIMTAGGPRALAGFLELDFADQVRVDGALTSLAFDTFTLDEDDDGLTRALRRHQQPHQQHHYYAHGPSGQGGEELKDEPGFGPQEGPRPDARTPRPSPAAASSPLPPSTGRSQGSWSSVSSGPPSQSRADVDYSQSSIDTGGGGYGQGPGWSCAYMYPDSNTSTRDGRDGRTVRDGSGGNGGNGSGGGSGSGDQYPGLSSEALFGGDPRGSPSVASRCNPYLFMPAASSPAAARGTGSTGSTGKSSDSSSKSIGDGGSSSKSGNREGEEGGEGEGGGQGSSDGMVGGTSSGSVALGGLEGGMHWAVAASLRGVWGYVESVGGVLRSLWAGRCKDKGE